MEIKKLNYNRVISLILSCVFIASAIFKLSDVSSFVFDIVFALNLSNILSFAIALFIISTELTLGIQFLLMKQVKITSLVSTCLLSIFSLYLLYLIVFLPGTECNCFGEFGLFSDPKIGLLRNIILIGLSILLFRSDQAKGYDYKKPVILFITITIIFGIVNVNAYGLKPSKVEMIEIEEVNQFKTETRVIFVDARNYSIFEYEHIQGAISVPYYGVKNHSQILIEKARYTPLDEAVIVSYCDSQGCSLAQKLAHKLSTSLGKKIYVLNGGIDNWKSQDLPVVSSKYYFF